MIYSFLCLCIETRQNPDFEETRLLFHRRRTTRKHDTQTRCYAPPLSPSSFISQRGCGGGIPSNFAQSVCLISYCHTQCASKLH